MGFFTLFRPFFPLSGDEPVLIIAHSNYDLCIKIEYPALDYVSCCPPVLREVVIFLYLEGMEMEKKLYVGNLSYTTSEEQLFDLFSQVGTVSSVELIKDRVTGSSKGFAFIEMSTQVEAETAISKFNDQPLEGRNLKVSLARPKEEHAPRRFDDSRRGGYGDRNRRDRGGGGQRRY
jgi:hypothetical protein